MKKLAQFLLSLCFWGFALHVNSWAQKKDSVSNAKDSFKQVAGLYGSNSGVCLFEDGKFLLYGYATMVFGSYEIENEKLFFTPDKFEKFLVFAARNKAIGDSFQIYFQGFEDGTTFLQLDVDSLKHLFNEEANCFSNPYIFHGAKIPGNITLFDQAIEGGWEEMGVPNAWEFAVGQGFNDFMIFYNQPRRERQDFMGRIELANKTKVLKLSSYGGDEGYFKQAKAGEKNWNELLEFKKQYYEAEAHADTIYANKSYNRFSILGSENYQYDSLLGMFVDIYNKDNDSYYQDDAYHDSRFLLKYTKLIPISKVKADLKQEHISSSSIFNASCGEEESGDLGKIDEATEEGVEKPSIGLSSDDYDASEIPIIDTLAVVEYPNYAEFRPFYVNAADGFYEVVSANYTDYGKTIFSKEPVLRKSDIESVKMVINEVGKPEVELAFKPAAAKTLEQFTIKNIDKPIAIIVNKMVVSMPVVSSAIRSGKVNISGSFTVKEVEEMVEYMR